MGAVFAAAAQAPLTAIASVVEMTGNYRLMLPLAWHDGSATAPSTPASSSGAASISSCLATLAKLSRVKPCRQIQVR
jgi:H+/Cl- antiporter ClcA